MGFATFGNELYSGRRSVPFIGLRRIWYSVAAVMMTIAIVALAVLHLNAGIEFTGGSQFVISKVSNTSQSLASDAVTSVSPKSVPLVAKLGTDGIRVQATNLDAKSTDLVAAALAKAYNVPPDNVSPSFVGPSWGKDISQKALQGLIVFLILVSVVIAAYFRTWKMAAAGLIALLHDLLLTVGIYALVRFEVTPATVIGFLTILGYSLYDTVVVFDKVRENTDRITSNSRRTYEEAANLAINQTLVRSINTSVVALLPVASILFIGSFILGAGTLKDISLALFVGIAAGTYSSIFIATPLLVDLRRHEPEIVAHTNKILRRRRDAAAKSNASAITPIEDDDEELNYDAVGVGAGAGPAAGHSAAGATRPGARAGAGTSLAARRAAAAQSSQSAGQGGRSGSAGQSGTAGQSAQNQSGQGQSGQGQAGQTAGQGGQSGQSGQSGQRRQPRRNGKSRPGSPRR